ncbi:TRAP transporter small permease subunit [Fodinicurvata halophila]|uniref:TRAP transporter small permease protein n=1 Tax=Fodinicurvata halophila TaxID=1419723 RepID=A0ABV8ULU2_9PROT
MRFLQIAIFGLSRGAAAIAGALLVAMVLHILLEIVLRAFFSTSTYVLDEFVGYGVAAVTFFSLGYALEHGALIRVNILLSRVHGWVRRGLEILAATGTLLLLTYFAWFFWIRFERNWERGTVSSSIAEVPIWIPEGLVLLGLLIFWLQMLAYLLRMIFGPAEQAVPYAQTYQGQDDSPATSDTRAKE